MTENEEEVTPEQTDLIVQYSQITGHEDLDKCKDHLKVEYFRKIVDLLIRFFMYNFYRIFLLNNNFHQCYHVLVTF